MALISVVTATYNRANVLRLSIDSLRAQTFTDWELIVVGDACTDDTEDVVASFRDPRMRFVNLPHNSGDQAVPNNHGARLARGEYLAILNHDDLWTRDHLATALAALRESQADLVFTITIVIHHLDGRPLLMGMSSNGSYEPRGFVPASSWLMRRTVAEAVGPWRRAKEIFATPSQEWLFRARKQGHRLVAVGKPTVIALHSGPRRNSYANRTVEENEQYAKLLRDDPELVARLMTQVAERGPEPAPGGYARLKRAVRILLERASLVFGEHPTTLYHLVRYRRRGGFIDRLHRIRGLPPLPRRNDHG
ncbi:MAG TPA: glycosyltransferase [Thermoanaerobaculia bacterium]|jgi:glycosyltransferase involved in cell wall biosynthesis|nr:glycosyltransferase [Thermoanaerobaculia bacterium]